MPYWRSWATSSIDQGFALATKYFAAVPSRNVPPRPDVRERPQTAERTAQETDKLAQVPALAIGYRMPPHGSQDAIVAAVTGELLHNGDASLLYQSLVKGKQVALSVNGGTNWPLGDPFEYNGPTLMTSFVVYPPNVTEDRVIAAYDGVIADLAKNGPSQAEITRVVTKMRSDRYDELEIPISRASALSHAVLFDGSFAGVYSIPQELEKVTPEEVKAFAAKYLVATNRTIINRVPRPRAGSSETGRCAMRILKIIVAVLLVASCAAAQGGKEQPLPKGLPPYGPQPPLRVPR